MANDFYQDDDQVLWSDRNARTAETYEPSGRAPSGTGETQGTEQPHDQHVGGVKLDDGKPDASLLQDFGRALLEVALVGTYGKVKYSRGGWKLVPEGIVRYTAAMQRHFFAEARRKYDAGDPFYDDPKGLPYKGRIREAAQTAWNALARLELMLEEEENNGK